MFDSLEQNSIGHELQNKCAEFEFEIFHICNSWSSQLSKKLSKNFRFYLNSSVSPQSLVQCLHIVSILKKCFLND